MKRFALSNFIASRWSKDSYDTSRKSSANSTRQTKKIIRIGSASIALCFFVMVLSVCILDGFKTSLSNKVFGFGSHLQIAPYMFQTDETETGLAETNFKFDSNLQQLLTSNKNIKYFQTFLLQNGLLQSSEELFGVLFKGLPTDYDSNFFHNNIIDGKMPVYSDSVYSPQILISLQTANRLQTKTGERVRAYFIVDSNLRPRSFTVCGIYRTGLEKFDEYYVFCDKKHLARINSLQADDAEGIEITLFNPENMETVQKELDEELPYSLSCYTCQELYPEIFDWLVLIDTNVWVMIIIVLAVSLISIVAILFIHIADRSTQTMLLLSIGAGMPLIRAIFTRQTFFLLARSMLYGNALALAFCILQYFTHLIKLNSAVYFLDYVPVGFPVILIVALNAACIIIAYALLSVCAFVLRNIQWSKNAEM
ncbi:MAG: ABC transporter permease [Bacteroidales bacterium]|jgi:lipoprotein-releasing system permease protein|nr:ABC transporter permease [Bacteroidales bacterium]